MMDSKVALYPNVTVNFERFLSDVIHFRETCNVCMYLHV